MSKLKSIAIIPARGGSKRLPRKNILDFFGKPMMAYTIAAAFEAKVFDKVVVSTEDREIAEVARRFGCPVSDRPEALATDKATTVEVCLDLLEREKADGRVYDVLCCLYATAPLRRAEDIAATMRLIEPGQCDFAIAATRYIHYAHQALKLADSGFLEPMWPEVATSRSDRVGKLFAGNGSTYAVSVPVFQACKEFYGPKMRGHIMPFMRSVDIDTPEDLEIALCFAEKLLKAKA